MKKIKKFSQILNESKESVVNEGLAEDLLQKFGYKDVSELKNRKKVMTKLESLLRELQEDEKEEEESEEEVNIDVNVEIEDEEKKSNKEDEDEDEESVSEEGDELDLDLDLGGEEDTTEEPEKEEEPEKSEKELDKEIKDIGSEESEEDTDKKQKGKKILSFDEFVSDKVEESVDTNDRFYNLSEIVEKYKDTNEGMLCEKCGKVHEGACEAYEKLEGHAKKMKEDGASDEEIKKMHPEVSDKDLNEAKINSDKEFEEYATTVLKKAFGSEFDEAKAKETIDGLKSKYKDDYGAMIGALTSGLGE